jgi:tetratricopeptide (TPR) repeat protein
LAIVDAPDATLWNTFAALLAQLSDDVAQHAAVQAEYRLALLLVDNAVLHLLLGLLQQAANQHDLALLSFEQALNVLDTDNDAHGVSVLVHQAIVRSYLAHEQSDDALDHLYEIQRLLSDRPTPFSSPHAFARPLAPLEVERMITELKYPHGVSEPVHTEPAALGYVEDQETAFNDHEEHGATGQAGTLMSATDDQVDQPVVTAPQPAPPVPQPAERNDALENIAALEKVARLRAEAGRIDEALTALNNAALSAWMLGQATQAARLIEQGSAWAPEHLRAWQQQVHVFLLLGDKERAVAAQRQVVQLAAEQQHPSLVGSLQQLLALDPDDPDAHMLFQHVTMSAM